MLCNLSFDTEERVLPYQVGTRFTYPGKMEDKVDLVTTYNELKLHNCRSNVMDKKILVKSHSTVKSCAWLKMSAVAADAAVTCCDIYRVFTRSSKRPANFQQTSSRRPANIQH